MNKTKFFIFSSIFAALAVYFIKTEFTQLYRRIRAERALKENYERVNDLIRRQHEMSPELFNKEFLAYYKKTCDTAVVLIKSPKPVHVKLGFQLYDSVKGLAELVKNTSQPEEKKEQN